MPGAPLMRTWRRSGAAASVPVPMSIPAAQPRRHREAARRRRCAPSRPALAPRSPRPGDSSETASSTLVLPDAILAGEDDEAGPGRQHAIGIGAEVAEGQAGDVHIAN